MAADGPRKRLVVIGGGAAGYFGAIQAAASSSELDVIVLEAGRLPLQKVKISGGGRCNVMHDTSKVCRDEDGYEVVACTQDFSSLWTTSTVCA